MCACTCACTCARAHLRIGLHVATTHQVLVLSPTRELATQTAETFRALGRAAQGLDASGRYSTADDTSRKVPLKVVALHGGVPYEPQRAALRGGAAVLVARRPGLANPNPTLPLPLPLTLTLTLTRTLTRTLTLTPTPTRWRRPGGCSS